MTTTSRPTGPPVGRGGFLLPEKPVVSVDAYRGERGGGSGMETADRLGPDGVIEEIRRSGLRGRGGAGFPTGIKWSGLRSEDADRKFVVCNAAEGEPGTFKDRWLLRTDPYQVVEGLAIAAAVVGAEAAYIGIKADFTEEVERVRTAVAELGAAGIVGEVPIEVVTGPDDYLFGEEKGLLEVIEGNDPLPRLYPPYVQGLFGDRDHSNPALVNNVETLANVPHILRDGSDWFRSHGTEESPGTVVCTVSGDVRRETVVELPMGTPLSFLVYVAGEGLEAGRRVGMAVSGVSNHPLPSSLLDTRLSHEAMRAVGTGLGSAGFLVYDDSRCPAAIGASLSGFLAVGSCGQCPPCKLGTSFLADGFAALSGGEAEPGDLEEMAAWVERVTDANRCGLGAGQRAVAAGILSLTWDHLADHAAGASCSGTVPPSPVLKGWDGSGRFVRSDAYLGRGR